MGFSGTLVSLAAGNEQSYQIGFALAVAVLLLGNVILLLHSAFFETFVPLSYSSVLVRVSFESRKKFPKKKKRRISYI